MLVEYFGYIMLGLLSLILATSFTLIGVFLGPKKKDNPVKQAPFETGLPFVPSAKNVHVKFYLVAMIFLIFDVEVAIIYPYALIMKELSVVGLIAILIFITILSIGILYEYKKKILDW